MKVGQSRAEPLTYTIVCFRGFNGGQGHDGDRIG
jgi:hypothetical protein